MQSFDVSRYAKLMFPETSSWALSPPPPVVRGRAHGPDEDDFGHAQESGMQDGGKNVNLSKREREQVITRPKEGGGVTCLLGRYP